jgi:hypothetical protein
MKYWILIPLFILAACGSKEVSVPEDVIPAKQMVPILVDVHIVEGARNGALILGDTNGIEDYYAKVYEKHGITEASFKRSFIPIYEKVLDSLKINGAALARKGVESDYEE